MRIFSILQKYCLKLITKKCFFCGDKLNYAISGFKLVIIHNNGYPDVIYFCSKLCLYRYSNFNSFSFSNNPLFHLIHFNG